MTFPPRTLLKRGLQFSLAYLLFLVLTMPASRAWGWLAPKLPNVMLYDLGGSPWSGHAALAVVGGRQFENFSWKIYPWSALIGRMEGRFSYQEGPTQTSFTAGRTFGGEVYLYDITGQLGTQILGSALGVPALELGGQVALNIEEVRFSERQINLLTGTISWENASYIADAKKTPLGNFDLTFSTTRSGGKPILRGIFKDRPGSALRADGVMQVNPDGSYRFTGTLNLRDPNRSELAQVLRIFSESGGPGGSVPLESSGTLPFAQLPL